MVATVEEVKRRFPVHWLVWNDEHEELKKSIESNEFTPENLELKDPRGRTPLLLAVTLDHIETVRVLLEAGADVNCEKDGWTAVQEATATGNAELLSLVLSRRDYQRHVVRAGGIPDLLRRLSLAPDFYVEMKWEFTSWVPLVSRMCPFDTYKVYKRGGNVRVDTTLVGFENNKWQRGDRTYIFRGQESSACLVELDHAAGTAWRERLQGAPAAPPAPPPRLLRARLAKPLAINYLDTDKISFERNKSGIWGWRQDKTENVNGYECKVFSANNVELISKTRSEHLEGAGLGAGLGAGRGGRAPLAGLLALADRDALTEPATPLLTPDNEELPRISRSQEDLSPVTWEEYFSDLPLRRDIGRTKDIATKVQKFKANLWLCENYPLQLQEQIMPILDLMASMSSPHFAKLKDFVQMQLPSGFPVKIEIPLFHVLNTRITFGNIFATESPVRHIECIQEGDRLSCIIDDACFDIGKGYRDVVADDERLSMDGEEGLLQYAIEQSLMEAGTHDDQVDVWEALRGARPASPPARDLLSPEDHQLQRAIEESLALSSGAGSGAGPGPEAGPGEAADPDAGWEAELVRALALSAREQEQRERQARADQEALDRALRLSLQDN